MATRKKTPAKGSTEEKPARRTAVKRAPAKKTAGARPAARKATAKKPAARKKTAARKKALPPEVPEQAGPPENPEALALARKVAHLLLDKKGVDVLILDVRGKSSYADYIVVGSGESDRQVNAMAEHVLEQLKNEGKRPLGSEGSDAGQWVLLDFGDVVMHLFLNETRSFYDLEGLWADAPREKVA